MFKEHNVKPSDWKGGEIHHEDILCAAIMKIPPLYLSKASFDCDIVIWNSVTELPYKQLTARKRVNTHKIQKEVIVIFSYKKVEKIIKNFRLEYNFKYQNKQKL